MPVCICGRDPETTGLEEEDLPMHQRQRVQTLAASEMDSLPRPPTGSSERDVILGAAKCLDKEADLLYEKIEILRHEAKRLRKQAFQKRALCAPIRLLPPEILSKILLMATLESFAFRPKSKTDGHPLSAVSRAWRHVIETSPEIWSQVVIRLDSSYRLHHWQDVESRLSSWLVKASNIDLKVTVNIGSTVCPSPSLASFQAVWTMLLPLVGKWRQFSYWGPYTFLDQFWAIAHSAVRLEIASLRVHTSDVQVATEHVAEAEPLAVAFRCNLFSRLQSLDLSTRIPPAFIRAHLPFATQLQTLSIRNIHFSEPGLAQLADDFPFVTRLHLEDIESKTFGTSASQVLTFERLERFEHSRSRDNNKITPMPPLPALQGCPALKSLRLHISEFLVPEGSQLLPSVERLELELAISVTPWRTKLRPLFAMLPSLKSLSVIPVSGRGWKTSRAQRLLEDLLIPGDPIRPTLCPQLSEVSFQRSGISNLDLISFIEGRTFNAAPETLSILEEYSEGFWIGDPIKWRDT